MERSQESGGTEYAARVLVPDSIVQRLVEEGV